MDIIVRFASQNLYPTLLFRSKMDKFQNQCLLEFRQGKSLTILGPAGSGKSYVLKRMIKEARSKVTSDNEVLVCAYTNTASNSIGGSTIHSSFGACSGREISKNGLLQSVNNSEKHRSMLMSLRILFIDEISMLKASEIEAIDFVLRSLSNDAIDASCSFANVQLVFCGDPFQLEPVRVQNSSSSFNTFFESRSWRVAFGGYGTGMVISTEGNYRQAEDTEYYRILQNIRIGKQSSNDIDTLNNTSGRAEAPPEYYTRIVPRTSDMIPINRLSQNHIKGSPFTFNAIDKIAITAAHRIKRTELKSQLDQMVPSTLTFKIGDRIILTRRYLDILPGTAATIINIFNHIVRLRLSNDFNSEGNYEISVKRMNYEIFDFNGNLLGSRNQIPLLLSYALTVRRLQGISLNYIAIDFKDFDNWALNGAAYVALSRCSTLNRIWIRNLEKKHISVSKRTLSLVHLLLRIRSNHPKRVLIGRGLLNCLETQSPFQTTTESSFTANNNRMNRKRLSCSETSQSTKRHKENF